MELAIRIIVVLFVAIVVGGLIIVMSQQLIGDARQGVQELQIENEEQIIETDALTGDDVLALANQCVRDNAGLARTTCYAVFAQSVAYPQEAELVQGHELVIETEANAVRFIYEPPTQVILR